MKLKIQNYHIIYLSIFIITCVMGYTLATGVQIGFSKYAPFLPNGVVFVFFHASLFHYVLNAIAMTSLIQEVKHIPIRLFCLLIILSVGANILSIHLFSTELTVGFSGVFCGIIGYLAVDQYVSEKRLVFITECIGVIVFTLFFPWVSKEAHFSGLVVGATVAAMFRLKNKHGLD